MSAVGRCQRLFLSLLLKCILGFTSYHRDMNTDHEPAQERHDGADVCPMCFKEVLKVANQCPHCGAPVDSPGLLGAPVEPLKVANPKTLFLKMLCFWVLFGFYLFLILTPSKPNPASLYENIVRLIYVCFCAHLAIKHTREWQQQRKAQTVN